MDNLNTSQEALSNLFNPLGFGTVIHVGVVLLLAWGLIAGTSRLADILGDFLPAKIRRGLLASVPLFRLLVVTLAVMWIIPIIFNVTFRNFILILGAISVALGFAFKDLASSAVAGITTIFERPFRTGDWVRVGDHYGEVRSIGTRSFSLRTADDDLVTLPHSIIWDQPLINSNDGAETLMCIARFFVAPDQETQKAKQVLREVAKTSAFLAYHKPVIVVERNHPYATEILLRAYPFDVSRQFDFVADLGARGRASLREAGLQLVSVPDFNARS